MKYIKIFVLCTLLCIPQLALAGTDPISTIHDVQRALNNADVKLFDASVDMESLVGQCVDIFMQDANKAEQTTLPPMLAILFSAASSNETAKETLRSTLVTEVSAFVRMGVSSGAYAGKLKENIQPTWETGILAPLLANASMGRKEILNIGDAIAESGAVFVSFSLKDHANGNTYPVEAWLREYSPGQWRVIGLRNVRTLVRLLRTESSQ